jgi:predicted phosphoribosyltransferase
MLMFRDRQHAGEILAGQLAQYSGQPRTLLLALPRGGVPVAAAIARLLLLPLDIFPVRKIGAPGQPEFAMGAVTARNIVVLNEQAINSLDISQEELDAEVAREQTEVIRRERAYRGDRPAPNLTGETVILVDDGLATGYTMLAAIRAVRQHKPARIVIGVPVASPEAVDMLRREADEVVCVQIPRMLVAVGQFYDDFDQTTDEEVHEALRQANVSKKLPAQSNSS